MIIHYLGLDHIGHKTGPNGPNMLPKQREMDGIVRQIYEAMEKEEHHKNTLLVLAGDHGMNAGGNHGGSGPGETEPALLFASPKLMQRPRLREYECPTRPEQGTEFRYYEKVQQSDLVPTLAGLMRFPISRNSLGVFIEELTSLWPTDSQAVQLAHQNAKQLKQIVEATYGKNSFAQKAEQWSSCYKPTNQACSAPVGTENELAAQWAAAERALHGARNGGKQKWTWVQEVFGHFNTAAQEALSGAASSYDIPRMVTGMFVCGLSLALAVSSLPSIWPPTTAGVFFSATGLLYSLMMFASSYVEEEQHFWYWLTPAWTAILTMNSIAKTKDPQRRLHLAVAGTVILAVNRVAVRWNQTGQKHAGEPDIVHTFFPEHFVFMWLLILITYGYECFMLARRTFIDLFPPEIAVVAAVALVAPAIVFKLNFTQADAPELVQGLAYKIREWSEPFSLVLQAQYSLSLLTVGLVAVVVMAIGLARGTVLAQPGGPAVRITLAERLHYLLTLFLMTQSRAPNIPLVLGLEAQRLALAILLTSQQPDGQPAESKRDADISPTELATSTLLLSHVYFFCFGGSNSISSVDLSNAYNGVVDYNIVAVGVLLFASNWTGPICWCSAAVLATFTKLEPSAEPPEKPQAKRDRDWINEERKFLNEQAQVKASNENQKGADHWLGCVSCMTAVLATSLLAVMAACTALRTHLFIWTVFSPKYLYAMAWCVGWHLLINIGLGSLLRRLGQIA